MIRLLVLVVLSCASPAAAGVAYYTIPLMSEALPGACDTLAQQCVPRPSDPAQDSCWIVKSTQLETVSKVRIHWWERYAPASYVLREKFVTGRGGQPDTLEYPDAPEASMWLTVFDAAGNESCRSNMITVNISTTGVAPQPSATVPFWYDIAGRRLHEFDGLSPAQIRERGRSGVLWMRTAAGTAKRTVILR